MSIVYKFSQSLGASIDLEFEMHPGAASRGVLFVVGGIGVLILVLCLTCLMSRPIDVDERADIGL